MNVKIYRFYLFLFHYVLRDQSLETFITDELDCGFKTKQTNGTSFFYHRDARICIPISYNIYSTQDLVYDDGFHYWIGEDYVSSCEALKRCNSSYVDGEYWLYPAIYNYNRVKIYCDKLLTDNPREFITLHHLNVVRFPSGKYEGDAGDCEVNETVHIPMSPGETTFHKIKFEISTGEVLADGGLYSTQISGEKQPFGDAVACSGIYDYVTCPRRGYVLVDLGQTGFKISPMNRWKTWSSGSDPAACDIIEQSTYRFEARGDGYCGGCKSVDKIKLDVDSYTAPAVSTAIIPQCG